MITRTLDIPEKMSFKKILRFHKFRGFIPSNKIIDKRVPGIGATSREIICRRHSIILEPFTAIIDVKKARYGEALCVVYGDYPTEKAVSDVLDYLNNKDIRFKKIMTTPESFYKVRLALEKFSNNYNNEFFMLIDECDVLIDDAMFRKNMLEVMPDFFSFTNKAMISATPEIPSDPRFDMHNFEHIILEPKYDFKRELSLVLTNNINATTREIIDFRNKKDDQPVFVFTNCKRTIAYLVKLDFISKDYMVFCNKNLNEEYFRPNEILNVSDTVTEQKYAKYNFFTSRFFAGVDFFLPFGVLPHIIMISNILQTPHSIINPRVDAVQIFGRCRKGISTITHITNLHKNGVAQEERDIIENIEKEIYHINELSKLNSKSYDKRTKKVIFDIIDKVNTNVIYKDGVINSYFKDNYLSSKLLHNIYFERRLLLERYNEGNFFIVTHHNVYKQITEEDLVYLKKVKGNRKSVEVLKQLHDMVTNYGIFNFGSDYEQFWHTLSLLANEDRLIYNAYFAIGPQEIARLKFNRPKLRSAVFESRKADKRNYVRMIDEILIRFPLNVAITIDLICKRLTEIYTLFSYEKKAGVPAKAKGTDIEEYFTFRRINGKKKVDGVYKTYYILTGLKYKLSEEAQILR